LRPDGYRHVVPFWGLLWTTLIFFAWVVFIWIAITVLIDVFRRHDISGWGKPAWVVFVVIIPWIGVLVYLIVNHDGMAERKMKEAQASQAQFDQYAGTTGGRRRRGRDREGQTAARQWSDQPGRARRDQGQSARLTSNASDAAPDRWRAPMVADREQAVVGIGTGLAESVQRHPGVRVAKHEGSAWPLGSHTADSRNGKMTDRGAEYER